MKKSYTVEFGPSWWECTIEIDTDLQIDKWDYKTTKDAIKDMVQFWAGWMERLEENEEDYVKTFIQQLAREINLMQLEKNLNLLGVIEEFNDHEGWCPMDGSFGIWIKHIDDFDLAHKDYIIIEEVFIDDADQEAAAV